MSSPSLQPQSDWDTPGHPSRQHVGPTGPGLRNPEMDSMGRASPSISRLALVSFRVPPAGAFWYL